MRRARRLLPQLVAAGVLTAGLVAAVTAFSGAGFAQGTAAQAEYAPANTTPPSISGTPQVVGC
jgi:peptidoglycan/LPS O-acetylase OafA/YrhL